MKPGIRIELSDGSFVELTEPRQAFPWDSALVVAEVKEIKPGHLRFLIRNPGTTEWGPSSIPVPGYVNNKVFFKSIGLAIPEGWHIKHSAFNNSRMIFSWAGFNYYACVLDTDRKPIHPRVVESQTYHFLEGVETLWWDAFDYEQDAEPPPAIHVYKDVCLEMLGASPVYSAGAWPRLRLLRSLYTMDASSLSYGSINRNLGWYMLHQHERYTQGRVPPATGYHDFGSIVWADGHSNHNYDPERYCVENYLKGRDQGSWQLAL